MCVEQGIVAYLSVARIFVKLLKQLSFDQLQNSIMYFLVGWTGKVHLK
jgi:hypothetical protein